MRGLDDDLVEWGEWGRPAGRPCGGGRGKSPGGRCGAEGGGGTPPPGGWAHGPAPLIPIPPLPLGGGCIGFGVEVNQCMCVSLRLAGDPVDAL